MTPIDTLIKRNADRRLKVVVVGDTLVDEYHYGAVRRVSPEFPVQVLHSPVGAECQSRPGGAANVVHQFKHWNVDAKLVGFVDGPAQAVYAAHGIDTKYCVRLSSGAVPVKRRFYDGDFPLLRWDTESPGYGCGDLADLRDFAFDMFSRAVRGADVVVLSDYDKGLFGTDLIGRLISFCNEANVPTVVDPKFRAAENWDGCTVLKPNSAEAAALSGESEWRTQASKLADATGARTVIITQGADGVAGLHEGREFEYRPRQKDRDVRSVIGAGDSFIAALAVCGGHKFRPETSAMLAFEAGAEYVKARHNRPVTPWELRRRLDPAGAKIVTPDEFRQVREHCFPDARITLANGCYDLIHVGHLQTLAAAKDRGDKLVVALNDDDSVRRLKGEGRPILPLGQRERVIAALAAVDFVVSFGEDTPIEVIKAVRPHVVVKGGDYKAEDVCGHGIVGEVYIADLVPEISTTEIIGRIKSSDPR